MTEENKEIKEIAKINDDEVSEEDIQSWLNDLDGDVTENKTDNNKTIEIDEETSYVKKSDFDAAIDKITQALNQKGSDSNNNESDENPSSITIEDVKKILKNENEQMKKEFLNVLAGDKVEKSAESFEKRVQEKYPDFKVDKLHLEYDVSRGMTTEQALEKQLKKEQQRIINYKKNFDTGAYKIELPKTSKNVNVNEALPIELQDFIPTLHENRIEFRKKFPTRTAKDEYFKKLEIYEKATKQK